MKPLLTIIISTLNQGIYKCENAIKIYDKRIKYIIVFQNHNNYSIPDFLNREDIQIISTLSKGLSNSRNIGLEHCKTQFALISDDDVEYIAEGLNQIIRIIENELFDVATFKINTNLNEPEYKFYPDQSYLMNEKFKHWVSSIEILINVDKIRQSNLKFDNHFGLGTLLKKGEEQIFLYDAKDKGLLIKYFPIYIVNHPFVSSGKKKTSEKFTFFYKGAYEQRISKRSKLKDFINSNNSILRKIKNFIFYYLGVLYIKITLK